MAGMAPAQARASWLPALAGLIPVAPGREGKALAGSRVAAMFTNDKVVRQILFRKGWIDERVVPRGRAGPS